jgi:hypothetical protein
MLLNMRISVFYEVDTQVATVARYRKYAGFEPRRSRQLKYLEYWALPQEIPSDD